MIHLALTLAGWAWAAGWVTVITGALSGERIGWAFARLHGVRKGHEDDPAITGAENRLAELEQRAELMVESIRDLDGMYQARRRALDRLRAGSRSTLLARQYDRHGGPADPVHCARCLIPLAGAHACPAATPADRKLLAMMATIAARYGDPAHSPWRPGTWG